MNTFVRLSYASSVRYIKSQSEINLPALPVFQ